MRSQIPWIRILAESMAIIASILIAFALDAWWDDTQERRREQELLHRIHGEFVETRDSLREAVRWHRTRVEASLELREFGGNGEASPPEDLTRKVRTTFLTYQTTHPVTGTLDGMLASGNLGIVNNDELRSLLAGWPAALTEFTEQVDELRVLVLETRSILAENIPVSDELLVLSRRAPEFGTFDPAPTGPILHFLKSEVAQNYAALRADQEYFAFRDGERLLAITEEILELLESEIR
jgi:hypothetical protein